MDRKYGAEKWYTKIKRSNFQILFFGDVGKENLKKMVVGFLGILLFWIFIFVFFYFLFFR